MFLFNFFGFLFFIAMGSEQIDAYKHAPYVSWQNLFMDGKKYMCSWILVLYLFDISGSGKGTGNGLDGNFDQFCVSCWHSL